MLFALKNLRLLNSYIYFCLFIEKKYDNTSNGIYQNKLTYIIKNV
jgi:hypothetical protein